MTKQEFLQAWLREEQYIQPEKCKNCRQSCCEEGGCLLLPIDIDPFTVENVIAKLNTGDYSITAVVFSKGDIQFHIQSRETEGEIISINKPHTRCALLKSDGCPLSREERPTYALTLIPGEYGPGSCKQAIPREEVRKMWFEVRDVMEEVVAYYSGRKTGKEVVIESFDKAALSIYQSLIGERKFLNYTRVMINATLLQVNMYDKIMEIAKANGTVDNIITTLAKLDSQKNVRNYNAYDLAWRLLIFGPYRVMENRTDDTSISEKIKACKKYNGYSREKRQQIYLGKIFE